MKKRAIFLALVCSGCTSALPTAGADSERSAAVIASGSVYGGVSPTDSTSVDTTSADSDEEIERSGVMYGSGN